MGKIISFTVDGQPVPKQSFRYARGRSFQSARVVEWQNTIGWAAIEAGGNLQLKGRVRVILDFFMHNNRADLDNLAKCVLDGLQGIVYGNDKQVFELRVKKWVDSKPRVCVTVEEL